MSLKLKSAIFFLSKIIAVFIVAGPAYCATRFQKFTDMSNSLRRPPEMTAALDQNGCEIFFRSEASGTVYRSYSWSGACDPVSRKAYGLGTLKEILYRSDGTVMQAGYYENFLGEYKNVRSAQTRYLLKLPELYVEGYPYRIEQWRGFKVSGLDNYDTKSTKLPLGAETFFKEVFPSAAFYPNDDEYNTAVAAFTKTAPESVAMQLKRKVDESTNKESRSEFRATSNSGEKNSKVPVISKTDNSNDNNTLNANPCISISGKSSQFKEGAIKNACAQPITLTYCVSQTPSSTGTTCTGKLQTMTIGAQQKIAAQVDTGGKVNTFACKSPTTLQNPTFQNGAIVATCSSSNQCKFNEALFQKFMVARNNEYGEARRVLNPPAPDDPEIVHRKRLESYIKIWDETVDLDLLINNIEKQIMEIRTRQDSKEYPPAHPHLNALNKELGIADNLFGLDHLKCLKGTRSTK